MEGELAGNKQPPPSTLPRGFDGGSSYILNVDNPNRFPADTCEVYLPYPSIANRIIYCLKFYAFVMHKNFETQKKDNTID